MPVKNAVSHSSAPARRGFSLIELLVVISIIGVLAGLTLAVVKGVTKTKYINSAQAEMATIEGAIERYHADNGVYPPSNPNNFLVNPLFFELEGTTNVGAATTTYLTTLDLQYSVNSKDVLPCLGVSGFLNITRGSGEDMVKGKTYLPNLKITQIGMVTNPIGSGYPTVPVLLTSVGGPDRTYQPLRISGVNPWRYNSANPTNSPGTYDLYVQLVINGQTNLICNWSKTVQINNPSYP